MDIVAERIFAKDRPNFMNVYGNVTAKPYGYILVDNQPKTTTDKQVVSDVFGSRHSYPHIPTSTKTLQVNEISLSNQASEVQQLNGTSKASVSTPNLHSRKRHRPHEFNQPRQKRAKRTNPLVKKPRKQSKPAKKQVKTKTRQKVYKPRFIVTPPREIQSAEEEEFNSEIETISSEEYSFIPTMSFEDHLNSLANHKKNGFGPNIIYE